MISRGYLQAARVSARESDSQVLAQRRPHLEYRADIDGLRAVAILSVIAFHAFPRTLAGGFLGVDVFFVISGYLVSGILLREFQSGQFRVSAFYSRRVRRLFPSLCLVWLATLAWGWLRLSPLNLAEVGKEIASSVGFLANFYFYGQSGYFSASAESKPLLHLWSLGVEEQFYIVWPMVLAFANRKKRIALACAILGVGSFLANLVLARNAPAMAFYLPFSRFWEMALGAGLVLAERRMGSRRREQWRARRGTSLSLVGATLIAVSVQIVNSEMTLPGFWALAPALGASFVIAAGPLSIVNRIALSWRPLVAIGLISYPLYLWHWPLLAFLRIELLAQPSYAARFSAVVATFALSGVTYFFLERPLKAQKSKFVVISLIVVAALLGAVGWAVAANRGAPSRWFSDAGMQRLFSAPYDMDADLRKGTCFIDTSTSGAEALRSECLECSGAPNRQILIWGDSHAAHLFPGFAEEAHRRGACVSQISATSCPPLIGGIMPDQNCVDIFKFAMNAIRSHPPAFLALGSRWSRDQQGLEQKLRATVRALKIAGVKRIAIFGPPPEWNPTLRELLFRKAAKTRVVDSLATPPEPDFEKTISIDVRLRRISAEIAVGYVSETEILCDSSLCKTRLGPDLEDLITMDYDHLPARASQFLVNRAFKDHPDWFLEHENQSAR